MAARTWAVRTRPHAEQRSCGGEHRGKSGEQRCCNITELAAGGAGPRQRCSMSLHINSAWTTASCCGALREPSVDVAGYRCYNRPYRQHRHHARARFAEADV